MKKTMLLIAAASIMAAAISCQKDQAVEKESNIASKGILTVTADIAQFASASTKTSIKGSASSPQPVWSEGDEIKLFNTAGGSAIYVVDDEGVGESSATFTPKSSGLSGTFACAYYPAENATSYTHGTGITATIPATQAYTAGSGESGTNAGTFAVGSFPMVGTGNLDEDSGNLNLTFKNVFGLLQLNFTGSETIKQIDLIGSANLSGMATITASDTPSCSFTEGQKYVTLTSVNQTLESSNSKAFYIAVPVGTISEIYITTATNLQSVTKSIGITRSNITSKNSATLSGAGFSKVTYSEASSLTPAIICGTVWAPVNCGYQAKTTGSNGYTYGKLYQWGRKAGQGYDGYDASYPTVSNSNLVKGQTSSPVDSKFYYGYEYWYNGTNPNTLWDNETYNPCPTGWCVPTKAQLEALKANKSSWTTNTVGGVSQNGYWFSGSTEYSATASQVFLPATGYRTYLDQDMRVANRTIMGYYWSKNYPNNNNAYYLRIQSDKASFDTGGRAFGFAVRCIKQ